MVKYGTIIMVSFLLFVGVALFLWHNIIYIVETTVWYWLGLTGTGSILYIVGKIFGHDVRVFEDS